MSNSVIQLYTWGTPNGRKISIALEEMGLQYEVHPVNLMKNEQFNPDFIAISPSNKIPAIVDPCGIDGEAHSIFESGAILVYLAEKTNQFFGHNAKDRSTILQWLMWQMGGFGPVLGQLHHFKKFAKVKVEYGIQRFDVLADHAYSVLNRQLEKVDYVAGEYSIADMAIYPWAARFEWQQIDLATYPNVHRWFNAISERPAVIKGMQVPFLN